MCDIAPGVDDPDHGLAHEIFTRVAHLQRARAVAERAQVGGAEPRWLLRSSSFFFAMPVLLCRAGWRVRAEPDTAATRKHVVDQALCGS